MDKKKRSESRNERKGERVPWDKTQLRISLTEMEMELTRRVNQTAEGNENDNKTECVCTRIVKGIKRETIGSQM